MVPNNPQGINQYTGKAKAAVESAKVKVGGVFANTKEKAKDSWEAVDKTVKYGAKGAAIGAGAAVVGGLASFPAKTVSLPKVAAAFGAAGGVSGAALGSTVTYPDQSRSERRKIIAGSAAANAILSSAGATAAIGATRFLGPPTPAKIAAGAVIGGAIGAYQGYKLDRAEEAERKATLQRQFKQV